ncbi:MAG: general secretion pathway protein GspK [Verrucomicrobiota bacterium JB025]|nr:type II secretion system protein GspK [Verrucomicrobiota bacterium JB025]
MTASPPTQRRGAALMAVIWLIAILSLACMSALRVISFDMEIAASKIHGSRARQIAEMGIALGSNPLVDRSDPILHQFDESTGEGFDVRIISEGERFNINAIILRNDSALLHEIFIRWGMEIEDAQNVADALIDWVDDNDEAGLNGAEVEEYEAAGRINQPFNRPFYSLSEMRLVRGMDFVESLRPDWRDWFTVWSGGGLDVNEAPAELIAAAAEITVEEADIIPESVRGIDGIRDTDDDVPFENLSDALALLGVDVDSRPDLSDRFALGDTTTRVESIGTVSGTKRKITVILRNRTGKPALLERTEEIIP